MTTKPGTLRRPTLLCILDGFGINTDPAHNAIVQAETPNFDHYFTAYPMTTLEASGRGVGLPVGQMGNSEVGHMTIGSGTIVKQDLVRIDDAIEDGSFFENPALLGAVLIWLAHYIGMFCRRSDVRDGWLGTLASSLHWTECRL